MENTNIVPSYKTQFDKITRAYLNNELDPYSDCACFIGNLLDGDIRWGYCRMGKPGGYITTGDIEVYDHDYKNGIYTAKDIVLMESNFLKILHINTFNNGRIQSSETTMAHENAEEALFLAMESTLELLKTIHEKHGEVVDKPTFNKRVLQTV